MRLMNMAECDGMDALIELDLSFSQARSLFVLAKNGEPMPIHAIAGTLGLSMAAAGRNVDQLVQLELVERRESPDDRRVKLVSLSPGGQKVVAQQFEHKRGSIREFVARLPQAQGDRLHASLSEILAGDCLNPLPCTAPRPTDQKVTA
ncbi:MAG: MarR family transcriptional regulator [Flavobacterium sp.]|nr:MarR family transcriptional regulator [Aeromicrobium sp.]